MLYIVFEKYFKGLYCKSNDLGWFARFRIQFLTDHIMIHSCLVCVCVCVCVKFRSFDRPHVSTAWLPQLLGSQTYSDEFDPSNPRSPVSYQCGFNYSAPKTERNPQNDMSHKTLEPMV